MARKHYARSSSGGFDGTAAAPARVRKPAPSKRNEVEIQAPSQAGAAPTSEEPAEHDAIARLAYSYYESRGYQGGSAEEDWFRAQAEYRARR